MFQTLAHTQTLNTTGWKHGLCRKQKATSDLKETGKMVSLKKKKQKPQKKKKINNNTYLFCRWKGEQEGQEEEEGIKYISKPQWPW